MSGEVIDFHKRLWSWMGITKDFRSFGCALNADSEEDAVTIGLNKMAIEEAVPVDQWAKIEVAECEVTFDDGSSQG